LYCKKYFVSKYEIFTPFCYKYIQVTACKKIGLLDVSLIKLLQNEQGCNFLPHSVESRFHAKKRTDKKVTASPVVSPLYKQFPNSVRNNFPLILVVIVDELHLCECDARVASSYLVSGLSHELLGWFFPDGWYSDDPANILVHDACL